MKRVAPAVMACCLLLLTFGCGRSAAPQPGLDRAQFLREQLAQLDRLAQPKGVKSADWQALKAALRDAIESQLDGKRPAVAPTSATASTRLYYDVDLGEFEWYYVNPGDYNQDGEVNISDLTPLAAHFGQAVPGTPDGPNTVQGVIDGDGNGLLTIADITPIGANLGKRVLAYNYYNSGAVGDIPTDNTAPSTLSPTQTVPISAAEGEKSLERIHFSLPHGDISFPKPTDYFWLRPLDTADSTEGAVSTWIVGGGVPPQVTLTANPLQGTAPAEVTLDASSTFLGETFYWDTKSDGNYSQGTSSNQLIVQYLDPVVYTATVKVVTLAGFIRRASTVINLSGTPKWLRYSLPESFIPDVVPTSIACGEYAGCPYAFLGEQDASGVNSYLNYVPSDSPTGNTWIGVQTNILGSSGLLSRMQTAIIESAPAVAAEDEGPLTSFDYCYSTSYPSNWQSVSVASNPFSLDMYSFHPVAFHPSIAYYDPVLDTLQLTYGNDTAGSAWSVTETPVFSSNIGRYASLAEVNGGPGIAYLNTTGVGVIEYVDSPGLGLPWSSPVGVIGSAAGSRWYDSLIVLADGSPALVYYAPSVNAVRIRRATDFSGDTWSGVATIAGSVPDAMEVLPQAVMVGGLPHAYWFDPSTSSLMHCACTSADGLTWDAPDTVATAVNMGIRPSPCDINGLPGVGYVTGNGKFKFAVRY